MFKAHRLVYHSTLSSRVIKKKKSPPDLGTHADSVGGECRDTTPLDFNNLQGKPSFASSLI